MTFGVTIFLTSIKLVSNDPKIVTVVDMSSLFSGTAIRTVKIKNGTSQSWSIQAGCHYRMFDYNQNFFFGVPHLATRIFLFSHEPELGAVIDPGMAFIPYSSSILDKVSFEPTP
jgi:hypothetical protein